MERETLEIRNFGPIRNAIVEFRPLTIFIGDQGTGKSTISKLLTICRDYKWKYNILEGNKSEILRPFKDFSIDEFFCKDTYLHYHVGNIDSMTYKDGVFDFTLNGVDDVEDSKIIIKAAIGLTTSSLIKRTGNNIKVLDSHTKNLIRANARVGLYIPAERNLIGLLYKSLATVMLNKIPLPDVILEFMSIFEKAKKEYPSFDVPFLQVSFIKKDGHDRVQLSGCDKDISFNACSSGLQSTLPMLMVIDYARKTDCFDSFVVEEPEQNLFPNNQRELMYYYASKLNDKKKCHFVLTTHSPYLLSCLNVQMLAYKIMAVKEYASDVESIIKKEHIINPNDVIVYSLGEGEDNNYCKSLISETTGLVSINGLDSVSEYIGDDFNRLYSLYLKTKKS